MQLIPLSRQPYRPSLLLKWPSASILLDCSVDLDALSSFLPAVTCKSDRFAQLPRYQTYPSSECLKQCGDYVFFDGPFEVHPVPLHQISMVSVDAILISNWMSLVALPFYTEFTNFTGVVYATDPTLQLGRLVMEELLDFFDRVDRSESDHTWKVPEIFMSFSNKPCSDPREWAPFYNRKQMESCLAKVQRISFRESVSVHGIAMVAAYSSGYSIGSSNWVIRTENEKIGYLSATSSRTSHTKAVHWDQLRGADVLILTSVCRFPEHSPETSVCNMFAVIADTLKKGGSVLLPICPTGVLYDLLEVISTQLDQHDVSKDVPVYFISPVAESTLAYSNIYAEWLSEKKQNSVNVPEEPFNHGLLSRSGRLKVFENIHGDFCRQMRTPCVIFTGHPSLRIGDAIHFLEMWGNESKNAIILTDPDYPIQNIYGPYEGLSIRAFFYPIETRLDFSQLNPSIIPDLSPKLLILPEVYTLPPLSSPQRTDFVVFHNPHIVFRYGDKLTLPSSAKTKRVRLHPDILRTIELRGSQGQTDYGFSYLSGLLSVYDNVLELCPDPKKPCKRKACIGKLDYECLSQRLTKMNIKCFMENDSFGALLNVKDLNAKLRIENDGLRTKIICSDKDHRRILSDVVTLCLQS